MCLLLISCVRCERILSVGFRDRGQCPLDVKHEGNVYGHIMLRTPVLVRSLKLSNIEPC